jgi:hypothetical protein
MPGEDEEKILFKHIHACGLISEFLETFLRPMGCIHLNILFEPNQTMMI